MRIIPALISIKTDYDALNNPQIQITDETQEELIFSIAARVFGLGSMVIGAALALKAITLVSVASAVIIGAEAVAFFVLGRNVFVLGSNISKGLSSILSFGDTERVIWSSDSDLHDTWVLSDLVDEF